MALSLNTSHALYPYLQNLICVDDDNVIKDLKNPGITFTQDGSAGGIIASAGYGRAFRVTKNGAYGGYVVTASSSINVGTDAATKTTIFVAFNTVDSVGAQGNVFGANNPSFIQVKSTGKVTTNVSSSAYGPDSTTTISLGAFASPVNNTVAVLRQGDTSTGGRVWINGAQDASSPISNTSGQIGYSSSGHTINTIGSTSGNGSISADIVYIAIIKGIAPSDAEISALHSSLTGSNAFALVSSGATATTLSGPSSGTTGVASSNFTVGANGAITGTVTVTPGDGGDGGTFTPTSVAISSGTPTATFTYTPASVGTKTISISDDGGLTDATPLSYTSNAAASTYAPNINKPRLGMGVNFYGAR